MWQKLYKMASNSMVWFIPLAIAGARLKYKLAHLPIFVPETWSPSVLRPGFEGTMPTLFAGSLNEYYIVCFAEALAIFVSLTLVFYLAKLFIGRGLSPKILQEGGDEGDEVLLPEESR